MELVHKLVTKSNTIPLDADAAVKPEAFALYKERRQGVERVTAVGWRLRSLHEGSYANHLFEPRIARAELDTVIDALIDLRARIETFEREQEAPAEEALGTP
jgi:hypothetical protein